MARTLKKPKVYTELEYLMKPRGCCKTTPMYSENFSGMPRPFQWLSNRTRYNNSSRYNSTRGYILFKTDFRTGPERKAVGLDLYNILNNNTLLLVWKQSGMGGGGPYWARHPIKDIKRELVIWIKKHFCCSSYDKVYWPWDFRDDKNTL